MKKLLIFAAICLIISACNSKKEKQQSDVAAATVVDTMKTSKADERGYLVQVGQMAPDFTMKLTDGKEVKLSNLRGKVVMLQFTASFCGVCRKEMPFIEKDIWLKHKSNPYFALYGIDHKESLETTIELAKQTGVTYPLGLDPSGDIFGLFADKSAGVTRNVIIDKQGKIVMLTRLFNETEFKEMVLMIDELLK